MLIQRPPLNFVKTGLTCALLLSCACATLGPFGADLNKTEMPGRIDRAPYSGLVSYYGYITPGAEPDELRDGKPMFYLYAWVPSVVHELGVRMVSPVKGLKTPKPGDFVEAAFEKNSGSEVHFDTWVRLERCMQSSSVQDIMRPCQNWVTYGENDNSSELPGETNSLLRVSTSNDDPLKALVPGLYRVAFTTQVAGEVHGTFLVELGAPELLTGAAMARNQPDLAKAVEDRGRATPAERPGS